MADDVLGEHHALRPADAPAGRGRGERRAADDAPHSGIESENPDALQRRTANRGQSGGAPAGPGGDPPPDRGVRSQAGVAGGAPCQGRRPPPPQANPG